jgi:integrase
MKPLGKISIKKWTYKNEKRYDVRFTTPDGKYHRFTHQKKTDADIHKMRLENEQRTPLSFFSLSDQTEASAAIKLAKRHGFSLIEAVNHYLANHQSQEEIELGLAIQKFLDAQVKKKLRPRSIASYRASLNTFGFYRAKNLVSAITSSELSEYIEDQEWGDLRTRRFLTELGTFFAFCQKNNHCKSSPTIRIDKPRVDPNDVTPLTVEECKRILSSVQKHKPAILAHICIGMFAGARSNEILRISWDNINFEESFIDLNIGSTKKRQRRLVQMHPTLKKWLTLAKSLNSQLPCPTVYKMWKEPLKKAKIKTTSSNMLRKTCVSYHIAHHQNIPLAMDQFGHSESVLYQHYRGVVRKSEAEKFWSDLLPNE